MYLDFRQNQCFNYNLHFNRFKDLYFELDFEKYLIILYFRFEFIVKGCSEFNQARSLDFKFNFININEAIMDLTFKLEFKFNLIIEKDFTTGFIELIHLALS